MCDFYSAIVTNKGEILTDISHSHSTIKLKHNLDDTKDLDKLTFCPIEILPKAGKNIWDKPTKENWTFHLGASNYNSKQAPKWWKNSFEKDCWNKFKEDWNQQILLNKEIDNIEGKTIYLMKDCKIKTLKNCQVGKMFGSSQVREMFGSSQVGAMWDNSQVGKMQSKQTTIRIFGLKVKLPLLKLGVIIDFSKDKTKVFIGDKEAEE